MPVAPTELQRITTNKLPADKPKARPDITYTRALDTTHHIRFTPARGAWTRPPQELQFEIRLRLVIPSDSQFIANELDIDQSKAHN